jgi:methyl-accepting chemotaxis protein
MSGGLAEISSITQLNTTASEETASSSLELLAQADSLMKLLDE